MGRARRGLRSACRRGFPSSGSSAMRVRAVIDPTPGTDARRSSFSRHAGDPRTPASISPSISESSFSSAAIRRAMLLRIRMTATRFSRLRSATIISMIWRRRATRSASSWVASSASGRKSGLVASTKRAIMLASIGSVFARRPSAWAKWRTCAGLTTTTGSEAPASAAATTVSKPPVASTAIRSGPSVPMRSTSSVRPLPSRATTKVSPSGRT